MKYSDDLFRLIRTMSKHERSYFKKFATAFADEEGSNYMMLFDEIVQQALKGDEYDEEKIRAKKYSGKFQKNFSYHKNYLYNMILSSMSHYHKDNKDLIVLRNLITQSELLFDKLLFDQCAKILNKARKMAIEKESFAYLCDILAKQRTLNKYILTPSEFTEESRESFREQYEALDKIRNYLDYTVLHDNYGVMMRMRGTGFARSKEEFTELDEFFEKDLMRNEKNATTFRSKTTFYNIKINHCMLRNDLETATTYLRKIMKLWEDDMNKSNGRFDNYLHALNNFMTCLIRTGRLEEWDETEGKMKGMVKKYPAHITEKNRVFIFYSLSVLKIAKFFVTLDIQSIVAHEREVQEQIGMYESKITIQQRIILYYFLGLANFVSGNFEKCIYWLGKIINGEKTDLSQDYQCYSRIIYLLCYYELGYYDSLEYAMRSAYHFLFKRKRVYKYENIILKYLRQTFRLKNEKELFDMFLEMRYELEKIYNDPFEQKAFDAFNILYWLESKIRRITLAEYMRSQKLAKVI